MGTDSGSKHFQDILSGLLAFAESPVVGHGLGNYQEAWASFSVSGGISQSSAFMATLSEGGLLLIVLYTIPFFVLLLRLFLRRNLLKAIPLIIGFVVFVICILDQALITYFIISLCYCLLDSIYLRKENRCHINQQ